eukprot:symbB.v1.2.028797.t1/scaffold3086.1/size64001/5
MIAALYMWRDFKFRNFGFDGVWAQETLEPLLLQLNIHRAPFQMPDLPPDFDFSPFEPDDYPKYCWDQEPFDAEIFFLHVLKTAGCSMIADLAKVVNRSNIYSNQVCLVRSMSQHFNVTLAMLRRPLDHVLSAYHHCVSAPNPHLLARGVGPGQPGFNMPDTFGEWVHSWLEHWPQEDYSAHYWDEIYHCKNPINMVSTQLLCNSETDHFANINPASAVRALQSISFVGIEEAYHESFCLFIAGTRHFLPSHCNCEDEAKWNSFNQTKEVHGHEYTDKIEDHPKEVLEEVEQMTKADKLVYQTGMARFLKDMERLESTFGVKVLCPVQRATLLEKIQ